MYFSLVSCYMYNLFAYQVLVLNLMLDNEFQRSGGSYRVLLKRESDADIADLENLFFSSCSCPTTRQSTHLIENIIYYLKPANVLKWCAEEQPIMGEYGGEMVINSHWYRTAPEWFSCLKKRIHEKTFKCHNYSMFEKGNTNIRECMLFIKYYLDKQTLMQCAKFSDISTAMKWAQNTRKV